MSRTAENLTNETEKVPSTTTYGQVDQFIRGSGSITEKPVDHSFGAKVQAISRNDQLRRNGNNYSDEQTNNKSSITPRNSDFRPIALNHQSIGSYNDHAEDRVQKKLPQEENAAQKVFADKQENCADECICKMKEAIGLITDQIKKALLPILSRFTTWHYFLLLCNKQVDVIIEDLETKRPCTPEVYEKKAFVNSIEKNSNVCHVIINELKNQRKEINEMLKMYEESSREYAKLELVVKRQSTNIEHIETVLESLENLMEDVRTDISKRHDSLSLEVEARRDRREKRENIMTVFLQWITSLDTERFQRREELDSIVKEAIEERSKDRATLILLIKQLEEAENIEKLLTTQHATTQQDKQCSDEAVPPCKCHWPIREIEIVPAGCNTCCAGGSDGIGHVQRMDIINRNGNGICYRPIPVERQSTMHGYMMYHSGIPAGQSVEASDSRRQKRKIRYVI